MVYCNTEYPSLSSYFVLRLSNLAISFLISLTMSLLLGGLNVAMRIPAMITPTTTTEATANNINQNVSSQNDDDKLPTEIRAAESKVAEDVKRDDRTSAIAKILLLLYVLITGGVAGSTVWNNQTTARRRASESALNDLQKEKIRADSARKTEVDTQRVRDEAANDLRLKTDTVRKEAKQEETRIENEGKALVARAQAEAQSKIEGARAEAARQIGAVQKDVAIQQERAANAERALLQVQNRLEPRATGEKLKLFGKYLEGREKGKVDVFFQAGDPEAQNFAFNLCDVLREHGWEWTEHPYIRPVENTYGEILIQGFRVDESNPPFKSLWDSLYLTGFERLGASTDEKLHKDQLVLTVGTRWTVFFPKDK